LLHHLPRAGRSEALREIVRVLDANGRVLLVEFTSGSASAHGPLRVLVPRHRHGHLEREAFHALVRDAGLHILETGPAGVAGAEYVVAARNPQLELEPLRRTAGLDRLGGPVLLAAAMGALAVAHMALARALLGSLDLPLRAGLAGLVVLILAHLVGGHLAMRKTPPRA
jgi:hypothetical protein